MAFPVPPLRWAPALISPTLNPVVIAGGGLAGATAACLLARAGRPVMLLERQTGPQNKVCGEFLSGRALAQLAAIGVDPLVHGAAPVAAMRLVHRGRVAESRLPFPAAALSRLVLDELLLCRAAALGVDVRRGVTVRRAEAGSVQTEAGVIPAPTLLLATGKHDLRGLPRTLAAEPEALIGFKIHLRLPPAQQAALAGFVEVVLFDGGYAGLQMVEGGVANLCLLADRSRLDAAGQDWPGLLAFLARQDTHLARRLGDATALSDRPLSIFRVPYGFVHQGADDVFRLGDQAAVIPSFCGDGMAIALHTAHLAAQTLLRGGDAAVYHRAMRRDCGPPVRLAQRLYRLTRSPAARSLLLMTARRFPSLIQTVARRTRVGA